MTMSDTPPPTMSAVPGGSRSPRAQYEYNMNGWVEWLQRAWRTSETTGKPQLWRAPPSRGMIHFAGLCKDVPCPSPPKNENIHKYNYLNYNTLFKFEIPSTLLLALNVGVAFRPGV